MQKECEKIVKSVFVLHMKVSDKAEKKSVKIKAKKSFQKILEGTIFQPLKCLIKEQSQISAQGGNLSKINNCIGPNTRTWWIFLIFS